MLRSEVIFLDMLLSGSVVQKSRLLSCRFDFKIHFIWRRMLSLKPKKTLADFGAWHIIVYFPIYCSLGVATVWNPLYFFRIHLGGMNDIYMRWRNFSCFFVFSFPPLDFFLSMYKTPLIIFFRYGNIKYLFLSLSSWFSL